MGLQTAESDLDVDAGQQRADRAVDVGRVVQQGGVEPFEQPVVDHELLARAALLGGRAEENDLAADCGATAASAMAAPTPLAAIELCPQPWPRPGSASYSARIADSCTLASPAGHARAQRGRQPADWKLDGVAVTGQGLCHPRGCLVLLEGRLRVGVDALRELDDLGARVLDGRRDACLDCRRPLPGCLSCSVAAELS